MLWMLAEAGRKQLLADSSRTERVESVGQAASRAAGLYVGGVMPVPRRPLLVCACKVFELGPSLFVLFLIYLLGVGGALRVSRLLSFRFMVGRRLFGRSCGPWRRNQACGLPSPGSSAGVRLRAVAWI